MTGPNHHSTSTHTNLNTGAFPGPLLQTENEELDRNGDSVWLTVCVGDCRL